MTRLTVSIIVDAPLETVWDALWNPTHVVNWSFASDDWYCPKSIGEEPKVGGIFINTFAAKDGSLSFDFTAQYNVVEPMRYIEYTMGEMKEFFLDAGRKVIVTFEKTSDGIIVSETFDTEDIHSLEQQQAGWQAILDNFKNYVEGLV